jgi:HEAT repeat protein
MNQRLYPIGSRSVEEVISSVFEEIKYHLKEKGSLSLSRNGKRFFVDKTEVGTASLVAQVFEEHGINGVEFEMDCPEEEVRFLVQGLSGKRLPNRSFAEWLTSNKVTHIHVSNSQVMEISQDEAVVAKGLSQFHALVSSEEMRASFLSSLEYIDKIPEKTMKDSLRQHLAERLVLMEATLLKELFDSELNLGEVGASVLEDVLAAMNRNKLLEMFNETLRWDLRLRLAGKEKDLEGERAKLRTLVAKLSECPSAKKIPRAVYDELSQRKLLTKMPENIVDDSSQDLRAEADRLLAEKNPEFLKGGGRNLADFLEVLLSSGFQDLAKDVVQRTRAVLLEGEITLRERAAVLARRFLPVLWAHLRDDLADRLRDAFLTGARDERAVPVAREILGALTEDLIHNYRARHTRKALDEVVLLCALRELKDSSMIERQEFAGDGLKRAMEELTDLLAEDILSTDKEKQEPAREFLSRCGHSGIPVFVKIVITSRDRALRSLAAEHLGQCGPAGARELAKELNMGNTTNALFNVVSVLGVVGGEEILEGLGTLVHYPDPDLRHAVVRILARLPGAKPSDLAVQFLGDEKESIRRLAAVELGDRKYAPAVKVLLKLLGRPSVEEAETICLVLGRIGDPVAVDSLARILKEKNLLFLKGKRGRETVRIRAAWALAQLGPAGQAQLLPYREDDNPTVREIALKAAT